MGARKSVAARSRCAARRRQALELAGYLLGELLAFVPLGWRLYRVRGASMEPGLREGDWVLVDLRRAGDAGIDELVVARDPEEPARVLIKRIRSTGDGTISLASDNPVEGRDSRQFGSLSRKQVIGIVARVLPLRRPG